MDRTALRLAALVAALALPGAGCSELSQLGLLPNGSNPSGLGQPPPPPRVTTSQLRLVEAPTAQQLAAYYCAQQLQQQFQLPLGLPSPCLAFGPVPTREQLRFSVAMDATFHNDSALPLPMAEALVAFTAFPQATGQRNLGAVCLTLCASGDSCPQNAPNACRQRTGDIRTLDDFGAAATNFLFALATGQERLENLRVRTIPPNGDAQVTFRLGLDPDAALALLGTVSQDALRQLQQGQQPRFVIPYRFEGTVWVEVEHFGRFAASIPPVTGQWNLQ